MQAVNLSVLNGNDSAYIPEPERISGSRKVHRFILKDSNSAQVLQSAAASIKALIKNNPHLVFVSSPVSPETLKQKISACRYLVINGSVLCLTDKEKAPNDIDRRCQDVFFSEAVIEEPVQCSLGHTFEKRFIERWVSLKGNVCPHQHKKHEVGSIEVDPEVLDSIQALIVSREDRAKIDREAVALIQSTKEQLRDAQEELRETREQATEDLRRARAELTLTRRSATEDRLSRTNYATALQLRSNRPDNSGALVGAVAKTGLKVATVATGKLAEAAVLIAGKKFPIVSVFLACVLAGYRCYQGYRTGDKTQYIKAVGEIASGVAACFPGIGTGVGIGIDGIMAMHDIYQIFDEKGRLKIDAKNAHTTLGLDPDQEYTKEQVDKAYREISRLTHPDRMNRFGEFNKKELDNLQATVNKSKDFLYRHYDFDSKDENAGVHEVRLYPNGVEDAEDDAELVVEAEA